MKKEIEFTKKYIMFSIMGILLLIFITLTSSFAFFSFTMQGTKENVIRTGKLSFSFQEQSTNLEINNAFPMSDANGKEQIKYFEFTISAETDVIGMAYKVIMKKNETSTFEDEKIKIYLTEVNGITETEKAFSNVSSLVNVENKVDEYIIFSDYIEKQSTLTNKRFRLRLWIDERYTGSNESTDGNESTGSWSESNKTFSVNLKVVSEGTNEGAKDYIDTSNASYPELYDNMMPVKYDGANWITANLSEKWYDYDTQEWANAIVVDKSEYNTYKIAGTVIPEDKILLMYVWVPRYEYTIYKGTNGSNIYGGGTQDLPGMIDIKFVNKSTPKVLGTANYSSVSQGTNISGYRTHDAFIFGDTELNGIWVGKFETIGIFWGGNPCTNETCNVSSITIQPNRFSVRDESISSLFFITRSLQQPNNIFGFTDNVNSHMIKNSEWGAAAYLTQSKYGKTGNSNYIGIQKEVYTNNSGSVAGSGSGRSGGSFITSGIQKTTAEQYATGDTNNYTYNLNGYYTYEGKELSVDGEISNTITDTKSGYGASTTGTIYGIYDMAGGAYEYTMGWLSTSSETFGGSSNGNHAGFSKDPGSKYWDSYTTGSAANACNNGICYGDALSETSGWYKDDNINFPNSQNPWFMRGGAHRTSSNAGGIFYFGNHEGGERTYRTSRATLTAK